MKRSALGTRIVLVVLAALLALPIAPLASPLEAKKRSRTITRTFSNSAAIYVDGAPTFPSPVSATLYPSSIAVSGMKGTIRDVNLRLVNLGHSLPRDYQIMLAGPRGQTAIVMANVGGIADAADATLLLDDEAEDPIPNSGLTPLQSGAFRPTNGGGAAIAFNAPAPPLTSANAALAVFDGAKPNGTWRLFVQDAYGPTDAGSIEGWALALKTKVKKKKRR